MDITHIEMVGPCSQCFQGRAKFSLLKVRGSSLFGLTVSSQLLCEKCAAKFIKEKAEREAKKRYFRLI